MSQPTKSFNSFPLVVIIDLDGTIIGDITPQIMTFEVTKALKTTGDKVSYDMNDLRMKLRTGLLRPYFESFLSTLNSSMNVEFFVYTASEKTWAELVIKNVEAVTGIKFNRPLFSRNFCIQQDREYKKGLYFVKASILKTLKKKYGVTFTGKDLSSNFLIVDNNNVYPTADHKHLIVCPTYGYKIPENVVANIRFDTFKKYHGIINGVLRKYIQLSGTSDFHQFQKEFYTYYLNMLNSAHKNHTKHASDKFWMHLRDVIITHKLNSFDEKTVKFINSVLRQKLGLHIALPNVTAVKDKPMVKSSHSYGKQHVKTDRSKHSFF